MLISDWKFFHEGKSSAISLGICFRQHWLHANQNHLGEYMGNVSILYLIHKMLEELPKNFYVRIKSCWSLRSPEIPFCFCCNTFYVAIPGAISIVRNNPLVLNVCCCGRFSSLPKASTAISRLRWTFWLKSHSRYFESAPSSVWWMQDCKPKNADRIYSWP